MPELVEVVLKAAEQADVKEPKAINGKQDAGEKPQPGQQGDPTMLQTPLKRSTGSSATSGSNVANGFLAPPFEWNASGIGGLTKTASPEPITTPESISRQTSAGDVDGQAQPNNDGQQTPVSVPAKKRPNPPSTQRRHSRRLSTNIFSMSGSDRKEPPLPRIQQKVTTESSGDWDTYSTPTSRDTSMDRQGRVAEVLASAGSSAATSPMRGPFSRLDSSRGQSMLKQGSVSSAASGAGASVSSSGAGLPQRRQSTGGSGSGSDGRGPRSSLAAARRLGAVSSSVDEGGETGDEDVQSSARPYHPERALSMDQQPVGRARFEDADQAQQATPIPHHAFGWLSRRNTERSLASASQSQVQAPPAETGGNEPQGSQPKPALSRSNTQYEYFRGEARNRWAAIRQKLKQEKKPEELEKSLTGTELVTDLSAGMMSVMMLKMAFDRDEHDQHRIPVLLNYLKLRITDSVYPFHSTHANFRIELEYGDGLLKWVIYRELRDFVNLHAHYRVANVTHSLDRFPPFPKVSIPYWNLLKKESREKGGKVPGKAEFAKLQRDAMENYLLRLVRAVMFRPEANRLCKFLELSAMSLALANKGGSQGKQGYLKVMSSGASRHRRPGFHPIELKRRHEPKWFMIRESYIVSTDEPYSTKVWDVFLIDGDFKIERPKRLYRQGIGLFTDYRPKPSGADQLEEAEGLPQGIKAPEGVEGRSGGNFGDPNDPSTTDVARDDPKSLKDTSLHTFYVRNAERKMKLVAKSERQMDQFINSIENIVARTIWAGRNRFGSFAPIRKNVAAQWLVDGRDYFWNLSRAILLAKEKIYIHDWWISPELYLRRPPAENGRWRLDRLLQRKAEEGVQIYIIVYNEVSNDFTPVDSNYTKSTLTGLHENILVQRSPNHAQTRTFLWSHHEKMCVIDDTIAFMGGLDLCFGRWDTPSHSMVDDGPALKDDFDLPEQTQNGEVPGDSQIWPGKDYANSRISDFFELAKPFEDMYDRTKTPREPWHDVGLQIIGQPARDLARHFIQRWNLLLRTKNHRRFMPFLLPPADFTAKDLAEHRLTGTCETQILRSAGPWSIGTPNKIEHSIQTAYIKAIQTSEHFVYIENQFFITSTTVVGTEIENNIGNALVARIQKAHAEGTPWRAIVVIPLEPGYPMPVDHPDAGSVRLIMECQYNTICRGENSIYARLRREGIDPTEYISFYGLRSWARMQDGTLATSDVYIHAKCMVVDDRIAIIGSANINERSQRGDRDSELACIILDIDLVDSTMAGKPYKVGRFAHTLRIRLMREHLGVDVDALEQEETNMNLMDSDPTMSADEVEAWDPTQEQRQGSEGITRGQGHVTRAVDHIRKAGHRAEEGIKRVGEAQALGAAKGMPQVKTDLKHVVDSGKGQKDHTTLTEDGDATQGDKIVEGDEDGQGYASTIVPTLEEKYIAEQKSAKPSGDGAKDNVANGSPNGEYAQGSRKGGQGDPSRDLSQTEGEPTTQYSQEAHDTRQLDAPNGKVEGRSATPHDVKHAHSTSRPHDQVKDLEESLPAGHTSPHRKRHQSNATLVSSASVKDKDAKVQKSNEQVANFNRVTNSLKKNLDPRKNAFMVPTKAPRIDAHKFADPLINSFYKDMWVATAVHNTGIYRKVFRCTPDDLVTTWAMMKENAAWGKRHEKSARSNPADCQRGDSPPGRTATQNIVPEENSTSAPLSPQGSVSTEKHTKNGHAYAPKDRLSSDAVQQESETKKKEKAKHQMDEAFTEDEIEQMIALLEQTTGHLGEPEQEYDHVFRAGSLFFFKTVTFPTRFLEGESAGQNFLWSKDRIPPIAIYD